MSQRVKDLIEQLQLMPHPEGGYYKEVYRSGESVHSDRAGAKRSAVTDIYFLLSEGQISRFHRVCHDEIWHFYEGAPLELLEIEPNPCQLNKMLLGIQDGTPHFKHCIAGNNWQAARSTGEYSLVGCTVAPGFDFQDFEFLSDSTERGGIEMLYPELKTFI
jgi:predicted cupin superfamily sugar epimerase